MCNFACKGHPRNDLCCVGQDAEPYLLTGMTGWCILLLHGSQCGCVCFCVISACLWVSVPAYGIYWSTCSNVMPPTELSSVCSSVSPCHKLLSLFWSAGLDVCLSQQWRLREPGHQLHLCFTIILGTISMYIVLCPEYLPEVFKFNIMK